MLARTAEQRPCKNFRGDLALPDRCCSCLPIQGYGRQAFHLEHGLAT